MSRCPASRSTRRPVPIAVIRRVMFMVDGLAVKLGLKHPHRARVPEPERNLRISHLLPLLAFSLSKTSPRLKLAAFWRGRPTATRSTASRCWRTRRSAAASRMRSWRHYLEIVDRLFAAGCIRSVNDLWWDVRPNAANGTTEVRICDMPADLTDLLGLTAMIQCLVMACPRRLTGADRRPVRHPRSLERSPVGHRAGSFPPTPRRRWLGDRPEAPAHAGSLTSHNVAGWIFRPRLREQNETGVRVTLSAGGGYSESAGPGGRRFM